jgi:hypothetical protein
MLVGVFSTTSASYTGFPRIIGRGRRREHPNQHGLLLLLQLPVAYTQREPQREQVTFGSHVTTTKKKAREKPGMRRTYFRSGPLPDMPLSVTHNIFPDMVTSGHVTNITSGHATEGHLLPLGFPLSVRNWKLQ